MTSTRRRGAELEAAIHAAVLTQLDEVGYAGLTFEGVAAAAGTSKPVLYRRWPTRAAMVVSAFVGRVRSRVLDVPDTRSLSGDLEALLGSVGAALHDADRRTVLSLIAEITDDAGDELRDILFRFGADSAAPVVERAVARAELGPEPLPRWVLALPFDLARHDVLVVGTLSNDRIAEIVAGIVVPLWRMYSRGEGVIADGPAGTRS